MWIIDFKHLMVSFEDFYADTDQVKIDCAFHLENNV